MTKTNHNFWESEWKINIHGETDQYGDLCQVSHIYRENYTKNFPFTEDNLIYRIVEDLGWQDHKKEGKKLKIYNLFGSNIIEEINYLFVDRIGFDNTCEVKLTLKTSKRPLSKLKHNLLERKINNVIEKANKNKEA